jgi:3-hydroxyisobutyrate dehydrogenase-like beta-hydroxyacid dehydrogenase
VVLGEAVEGGRPFGALHGLSPGGVLVDMTTSQPSLAREIAAVASSVGCFAIDAPVSGGDLGAKKGTLSIMAGGDAGALSAVAPLLNCLGSVRRLGGPGTGQSCKMANQVCIATTMVGLVEGLLYAHKAGLDVEEFLAAVRGGAAGSKSMELYADRLLQRDLAPGFFVKHFVKDLGIALTEAQGMQLSLPGLALAQQLYVALEAKGHGNCGTQALLLALEDLNAVTLPTVSK